MLQLSSVVKRSKPILPAVTAQTTARTVDAQGDVQEGIKTVTMQIGSFTEFYAWNVQQSTSHTFMASTIPTGTVTSLAYS